MKCHLFRHIRAPYIFPARPQDSLFPYDESEAPNGDSLALIVGDVNTIVLTWRRNDSKDAADRLADGMPFQTCGAAERKARDAILVFVLCSTNKSLPADRKIREGV